MSGRFIDDYGINDDRFSYYGTASVPFIWESTPGTPKNHYCSEFSLPPPLTPPPSFYSSSDVLLSSPKKQSKVRTKLSKFFLVFNDLRRSNNSKKKTNNTSSFYLSSTSSSSSLSSSPPQSLKKLMSFEKKSPLLVGNYGEDEMLRSSSPTSTLCGSNGGKIGSSSSSMGNLKRVLFSGSMESMKRH